MEVSVSEDPKERQEEFSLVSVSELSASASASPSSPVIARFTVASGVPELRFLHAFESTDGINLDLETAQVSISYCPF